METTQKAPTFKSVLVGGWQLGKAAVARRIALGIVWHVLLVLVALPLIHWLFKEALRSSGMNGVDIGNVTVGPGWPLSVLLLTIIAVIALWVMVAEIASMLILITQPKISTRGFFAELSTVSRKLFGRGSILFALYLFVVLPLSGFGFVSQMTRGIAIPRFITGELEKQPLFNVVLIIGGLLLIYLNIRLALTLPLFVATTANGWNSLKLSWKLTRTWRVLNLILAVVAVMAGGIAATWVVSLILVVPTWLTDMWAPSASPYVAAYSLGAIGAALIVVVSTLLAVLAGTLLSYLAQQQGKLSRLAAAQGTTLYPSETAKESPAAEKKTGRSAQVFVYASLAVVFAVGGTLAIPLMMQLDQQPQTLVLGHRGAIGQVENSIEALELAATMNPDLVEMDVQQTKDHQYVVIHDPNLKRLAGQDVNIKDLTLEEATQIEIHDDQGNTAQIPSLVDYAKKAKELGVPLLIEIKLSGAEGPNHVQELLDVLDENDLYDGNHFHSLDEDSVNELKRLRPDATVGYLMPFAGVGLPDNSADFLGVEEWTATDSYQKRVEDAGLGFYVWTVDDPHNMEDRIRRGVGGIITDYPDKAVQIREEIAEERGMVPKLLDLIDSFVIGL